MSAKDAKTESNTGVYIFELPVYCSIAQAMELKHMIQELFLQNVKSIEIDASANETFDTTAVQLMIQFYKEASAAGYTVSWNSISERIQTIASLLKVEKHIGIA